MPSWTLKITPKYPSVWTLSFIGDHRLLLDVQLKGGCYVS